MTDIMEKLVELLRNSPHLDVVKGYKNNDCTFKQGADWLIAHGVTVRECCHKAESVISKTGLLCTACHSDIDRDAVFCKYCGAKVMLQPPKGE